MSEFTDTGRADSAGGGAILTTPRTGPEMLFQVGPVVATPGSARSTMPTGRWLLGHGERPSCAGLGVLVDDVLGQVVLNARPSGHWAVTTELNIDVAAPLPTDGQEVSASAAPVLLDNAGGLGRAQVRDAAGRCLAQASGWLRYAPGVPDAVHNPPQLAAVPEPGQCLTDLLQAKIDDTGRLNLPVRADLGNPRGVLHGGILLCLAIMTTERLVHGYELDIASARVVYVRPALGELQFEPVVIHRGRSLGIVRVDVRNAAGALCTTATVTARSTVGPKA